MKTRPGNFLAFLASLFVLMTVFNWTVKDRYDRTQSLLIDLEDLIGGQDAIGMAQQPKALAIIPLEWVIVGSLMVALVICIFVIFVDSGIEMGVYYGLTLLLAFFCWVIAPEMLSDSAADIVRPFAPPLDENGNATEIPDSSKLFRDYLLWRFLGVTAVSTFASLVARWAIRNDLGRFYSLLLHPRTAGQEAVA